MKAKIEQYVFYYYMITHASEAREISEHAYEYRKNVPVNQSGKITGIIFKYVNNLKLEEVEDICKEGYYEILINKNLAMCGMFNQFQGYKYTTSGNIEIQKNDVITFVLRLPYILDNCILSLTVDET